MNEHLNIELQELREALRGYQDELRTEKESYQFQIDAAQNESEKIAQCLVEHQQDFQRQCESKDNQIIDLKEALDRLQRNQAAVEEELRHKFRVQESQAQNQIAYLQKRLKDVVEEAHSSSQISQPTRDRTTHSVIRDNCAQSQQGSLLTVLRSEFDRLGKEVLDLRETIRGEGMKDG